MEGNVICGTVGVEASQGELQKAISKINSSVDIARDVHKRMEDLRIRLIGNDANELSKEGAGSPEPVRPQINELAYRLYLLRDAHEQILNELAELETI